MRTRIFVGCVAMLLVLAAAAAAQKRVDLPTRPGVTQPIYPTEASSPVASVVLFPGGSGVVNEARNNFLIRVAPRFVAFGVTVAVADAPSDHSAGLGTGYRASNEAAVDAAAIVAWLRGRAAVPVWLVGTSRGSISAANVARRLGPSRVAGVVLTSSVWGDGMEAVPLGGPRIPTLIVHNRDDTCRSSPFDGATKAYAVLGAGPAQEFLAVSGGSLRGDPCGAMSPHGYFGIEDRVVSPIVAWIKTH
jgi:pimeloyl-ACP methyl ester carboxylesterase